MRFPMRLCHVSNMDIKSTQKFSCIFPGHTVSTSSVCRLFSCAFHFFFFQFIIGQIDSSEQYKERFKLKHIIWYCQQCETAIEMGCGMSASSTEPGSSPRSSRSQRQRNVESFQYNQIGNRVRIIFIVLSLMNFVFLDNVVVFSFNYNTNKCVTKQ